MFAFLGLSLAFAITVVLFTTVLSRRARWRRRMRKTPNVAVSALTDGSVACVSGVVSAHGDTVSAPVSGRACVYTRTSLVAWEASGRRHERMSIFAVPCRVRDDAGAAVELALTTQTLVRFVDQGEPELQPVPADNTRLRALIERAGKADDYARGAYVPLALEQSIPDGARVSIRGRARVTAAGVVLEPVDAELWVVLRDSDVTRAFD